MSMRRTDLSLRAVSTFVAIAECGGIARAAEELGYSQPAVTIQLQQLEERLGVKLFERASRQVRLTGAGKQALEPARTLLGSLAAFERAATRATAEQKFPLIIGAIDPSASEKLPSLLSAVRRAVPDVTIKVTIAGGDSLAKAAERGAIHAAVTVPTKIPGWVYEPLFNERFVLLVRSDHRLARQASVALSQLQSEQLLLTDETCVYRKALERAFSRYGVEGSHVVESSSLGSLPNSVLAGLGVAVVPKPSLAQVASDLRVVTIRERIEMTIGLLRPKTFDEASPLGHFVISAYDLRKR